MKTNQPQPPIPDTGISKLPPLNLPCGRDLNQLRIQLSDGLNLTALIDHLESCERWSQCQCQGEVVREVEGLMVGGETMASPIRPADSCSVYSGDLN